MSLNPRLRVLCASLSLCLALAGRAGPPDQLGYHDVRLDSTGRLAPWYGDGPDQAYDHVIGKVWNFWITMRPCPNGVPYYLLHQVWKPDVDDPRGLGGDQINMALSSWNLLYGYTGDPAVRANMVMIADYWMKHGIAPASLPWGGLPYPYNGNATSGAYDGDMRAGPGVLQPDKAASFGAELIMLYKATGDRRYLDCALTIADRLEKNVVPGDEGHSPWPFRVNAATGAVPAERNDHDHKIYTDDYTANWTGALRLFDGLSELGEGDVARHKRTSALVTRWLKAYPLANNRWGPFFEDVSTKDYSDTEINADTLAMYILEHPAWDPEWTSKAKGILDWSYRTFANPEAMKWGVMVINEQTQYPVPGESHTARHASVELMYAEKTGDTAALDAAIRRLTWATYWVDDDGRARYPRDDIWLTDGYGDFVRHYLRAMASLPALAPKDQNHLLRTSSVIKSIRYGDGAISFTVFDARSEELFKLGKGLPTEITGGTMTWDPKDRVLRVYATNRDVVLTLAP